MSLSQQFGVETLDPVDNQSPLEPQLKSFPPQTEDSLVSTGREGWHSKDPYLSERSLARRYPGYFRDPNIEETGAMSQLMGSLVGYLSGTVNTISKVASDVGLIDEGISLHLHSGVQSLQRFGREIRGSEADYDIEHGDWVKWLTCNLASGIGSFAPLVLETAATGGVGRVLGAGEKTRQILRASTMNTGMFMQSFGDNIDSFRRNAPKEDEAVIRGAAFLSTAIETAIFTAGGPIGRVSKDLGGISRLAGKDAVIETMKSDGGKELLSEVGKQFMGGYPRTMAESAFTLGLQSAASSLVNEIFIKAQNPNHEMPSPKDFLSTFMESLPMGSLFGGFHALIKNHQDNAIKRIVKISNKTSSDETMEVLKKISAQERSDFDLLVNDLSVRMRSSGLSERDAQEVVNQTMNLALGCSYETGRAPAEYLQDWRMQFASRNLTEAELLKYKNLPEQEQMKFLNDVGILEPVKQTIVERANETVMDSAKAESEQIKDSLKDGEKSVQAAFDSILTEAKNQKPAEAKSKTEKSSSSKAGEKPIQKELDLGGNSATVPAGTIILSDGVTPFAPGRWVSPEALGADMFRYLYTLPGAEFDAQRNLLKIPKSLPSVREIVSAGREKVEIASEDQMRRIKAEGILAIQKNNDVSTKISEANAILSRLGLPLYARDRKVSVSDQIKKGAKVVTLTHWSKRPGLSVLSPSFEGERFVGRESERKANYPDHWVSRIHMGGPKYSEEMIQDAPYRYTANVPSNRLYDMNNAAKDGMMDRAMSIAKREGISQFDQAAIITILEEVVKKSGKYDGFYFGNDGSDVVQMFKNVPVSKPLYSMEERKSPIAQVSVESVHGGDKTSRLRFMREAGYEFLDRYNSAIQNAFLDEAGENRLAKAVGLKIVGTHNGPGLYGTENNPSTQYLFDARGGTNPDGTLTEDFKQKIRLFSSAYGKLTNQDSVGWHHILPSENIPDNKRNGHIIKADEGNRALTVAERKTLQDALDATEWKGKYAFASDSKGLHVFEFMGAEDYSGFHSVIEKTLNSLTGKFSGDKVRVESDLVLGAAEGGARHGLYEDTLKTGRPDLLASIRDFEPRMAKVNAEYSTEFAHTQDLSGATPDSQPALIQTFGSRSENLLGLRKTLKQMVADAESMKDWRDWYEKHRPLLEEFFGEDSAIFSRFIAATSPRTKVDSENVKRALDAYEEWKLGLQNQSTFGSHRGNIERVRRGEPLSGVKVSQFDQAMRGDPNAVAIDVWMGRYLFGEDNPSDAQKQVGIKVVSEVSKKLGGDWTPLRVQAALWCAEKQIEETQKLQGMMGIGGQGELFAADELAQARIKTYEDGLRLHADRIKAFRSAFAQSGAKGGRAQRRSRLLAESRSGAQAKSRTTQGSLFQGVVRPTDAFFGEIDGEGSVGGKVAPRTSSHEELIGPESGKLRFRYDSRTRTVYYRGDTPDELIRGRVDETLYDAGFRSKDGFRHKSYTDAMTFDSAADGFLMQDDPNSDRVDSVDANSQSDAGNILGQYFRATKTAVFFKNAGPDTFLHEYVHHLRTNGLLPDAVEAALLDASGEKTWTTKAEEFVADSLLAYLDHGQLPENATGPWIEALNSMRDVIAKSVPVLRREGVEVSPEVETLFTRILQQADAMKKNMDSLPKEQKDAAANKSSADDAVARAVVSLMQNDDSKPIQGGLTDRNMARLSTLMRIYAEETKANPHDLLEENGIRGYVFSDEAKKAGSKQDGDMTNDDARRAIKLLGDHPSVLPFSIRTAEKAVASRKRELKRLRALAPDELQNEVERRKSEAQENADRLSRYAESMPDSEEVRYRSEGGSLWFHKMRSKGDWLLKRVTSAENIFKSMDGGNEDGLFTKTFWTRMWKASSRQADRINIASDKITATINRLGGIPDNLNHVIKFKDGQVLRRYSLSEIIGIYMHSQAGDLKAESTKALMERNTDISERVIREAKRIVETNGKAMNFVRVIQDYMNTAQEELNATVKLVHGREMGNRGRFYLPFVGEDGNVMEVGGLDVLEALTPQSALPELKGVLRSPSQIKERGKVMQGRLDTDSLKLFLRYMESTENFNAKAPLVQEMLWMLNDPTLSRVISDKFTPSTLGIIRDLVAKEMSPIGRLGQMGMFEATLQQLRSKAMASFLGMNPITILKQPVSMFNAFTEIDVGAGIGNFFKSMGYALAHLNMKGMPEYEQMVKESPILRLRTQHAQIDPEFEKMTSQKYGGPLAKAISSDSVFARLLRNGMTGIRLFDSFTIVAIYTTAKNMALADGKSMQEAILDGERAVRKTQSPTMTSERSAIQGGNEWIKATMLFSGQLFKNLDQINYDIVAPIFRAYKKGGVTEMSKALWDSKKNVMFVIVLPALAMGMIARRRPQQDNKEILLDLMANNFSSIPLVGTSIAGGIEGFDSQVYSAVWADIISAHTKIAAEIIKGDQSFSGKDIWNDTKSMERAWLTIMGLPQYPVRVLNSTLEEMQKSGTASAQPDLVHFIRKVIQLQPKEGEQFKR